MFSDLELEGLIADMSLWRLGEEIAQVDVIFRKFSLWD